MEPGGNTSSRSASSIGHASLPLALILVLGGILRVVPIWFGLPYTTARPDEETSIGHAIAVLGGDPNPHFFHWPSLTFYVLAGLFQMASTLRELAGLPAELTDGQRLLIGRGCVALAGTATIAVLFGIGRLVGGRAVGLTAALFLAVSMLHVRESHFAMTDVMMTFFATAALALLLTGFEDGGRRTREWAAAGLAAGLAASTKYTAVALLASLAAAQGLLLIRGRRMTWDVWLPAAAFMAFLVFGFVTATPFAVLDAPRFVRDFAFNMAHLSEGHVVNLGRGWGYHATRSLPYGLSLPIFLAALAGAVPFARRHAAHVLIAGAFALAVYASVGNGYTVFFRYVLPVVPVLCLSAAVGVVELGRLATQRGYARASTGVLAAVFAAWGAITCAWFDVLLARKDTRVLAREWLDAHTTRNDTLYEAETPYAMLDLQTLPVHSWRYDPVTASFVNADGRTPDWLVLHESPLWTYSAVPAPLRRLAAARYDLVQTIAATRGAARRAVYDLQDAFFMPVSGFNTVIRPGPTVLIYRRRP